MKSAKEAAEEKSLRWCDEIGRGLIHAPEEEPRGRFGGAFPEIGETRSFVPAAFTDWTTLKALPSLRGRGLTVTGRVVYVNRGHRWCRVEYDLDGCGKGYECFKF